VNGYTLGSPRCEKGGSGSSGGLALIYGRLLYPLDDNGPYIDGSYLVTRKVHYFGGRMLLERLERGSGVRFCRSGFHSRP
jgi:hypothetical protein